MREPLPDHSVIVSPHLDDAVLSIGATIARATRSGHRVEVVTVFAGDPDSVLPAGGWDRRCGFATEGEATTARRLEDQEACRIVGAEPSWLSFSEADYSRTRDRDGVWSALVDRIADADAMLVPGFPLTNPDHAWLSEVLIEHGLPSHRIGLYAEQPYRYMVRAQRRRLQAPAQLAALGEKLEWTHGGARARDLLRKRRAILAYGSQLPRLGLTQNHSKKLYGMLLDDLRHGEAIAWVHG